MMYSYSLPVGGGDYTSGIVNAKSKEIAADIIKTKISKTRPNFTFENLKIEPINMPNDGEFIELWYG